MVFPFRSLYLLAFFLTPAYGQTDRYIDPRTGIPIIFISEPDMFPSSWLTREINQQSKPVDTSEIERSKRIILNALSKYPVKVVRRYLERIYVTSELRSYNTSIGGTRSMNRVYINNNGEAKGYFDDVIEHIFHAEFSSVLLLNSDTLFSSETWNSFNDTGFVYGNDDFASIREGRSHQAFDSLYNARGFLNQYACTTMENDFNAFAQYLFLPPNQFIDVIKKYPRLKRKLFYVIDFYTQIDPGYAVMKFTYMF